MIEGITQFKPPIWPEKQVRGPTHDHIYSK